MKKLLLIGALAFAVFFNAQEKEGLKGTWFATAQVGYQQTKTDDVKSSVTTILPIVGYFVAPTTAVGVAVGNIGTKATVSGTEVAKANLFVLEPLVRKYYNVSGGLFFFGQLAAPIITGKEKISELKANQFGLTMSGGLDYVIGKHFTVEFSYNLANLSTTTIKAKDGTKTTVTDFSSAHVATPDTSTIAALGGSGGNLISPLSFGFKFLF